MTPEVERILARRPDGFVVFAEFVTRGEGGSEEEPVIVETEATDAAIEEFLSKAGVPFVAWRRIELADLPADGFFRNAWRDSGDEVTIDMVVALEIARDYLRRVRAPLFLQLDVQAARAVEQANTGLLTLVAADKQRLRDITDRPEILSAETPEALRNATEEISAEILNPL